MMFFFMKKNMGCEAGEVRDRTVVSRSFIAIGVLEGM